jgi:hypothetical protein
MQNFSLSDKKNIFLMDKKSLIFLRWDKNSPIFPYRDKKSGQKSLNFSGGKKIANSYRDKIPIGTFLSGHVSIRTFPIGTKNPSNFFLSDIKGVLKILNAIPNPSRRRQQSSLLWPWWSENVRVIRMVKTVSPGWRLETFILGGDLKMIKIPYYGEKRHQQTTNRRNASGEGVSRSLLSSTTASCFDLDSWSWRRTQKRSFCWTTWRRRRRSTRRLGRVVVFDDDHVGGNGAAAAAIYNINI